MEQECDSRDHSEDDSSPTDTSEDSVDVKVQRIYLPGKHHRNKTIPIDLRKSNSSSANVFEPSDISIHQLKSSNPCIVVGPDSLCVAEELPPKRNFGPLDFKARKCSRRKASDPRRILTNEGKRIKRCFDTEIDGGPPSKLLRPDVKTDCCAAGPSTGLDTKSVHLTTSPPTFHPLMLSNLHPMISYPYSHVVNNIMVPHLSFLAQGLNTRVPYSVFSDHSPTRTQPTERSRFPNSNSVTDQSAQNALSKECETTKVSTTKKEKLEKNKPKRPGSSPNHCVIPPITTEPCNREPQEQPLDYSLGKLSISKDKKSNTPLSVNEHKNICIDQDCGKHKQRNYKNMTRERRIEANARERTRVHTISAAFEKLRQSVPSYSNSQKLSKLSVLRIACTYILSLSRLAGLDYSLDETSPSFEECVDLTTKTIQIEGNTKKRKDG